MNRLMQAEITEAFEALSGDEAVGAIVVTGEGRGFMAGADIKEYAAQTRGRVRRLPGGRHGACTRRSRTTASR